MIVTRKNLAREALDQALEVREEAEIAFNVPLCIYGLCDRLRVRVQFVDINMEGLDPASTRPIIQISSLRPLGSASLQFWTRTRSSCFWSWFDAGTNSRKNIGVTGNSNPKEIPARCRGGFLSSAAECRAAGIRRSQVGTLAQATPEQCFRIACGFGVGYETLVSHLAHGLRIISGDQGQPVAKGGTV